MRLWLPVAWERQRQSNTLTIIEMCCSLVFVLLYSKLIEQTTINRYKTISIRVSQIEPDPYIILLVGFWDLMRLCQFDYFNPMIICYLWSNEIKQDHFKLILRNGNSWANLVSASSRKNFCTFWEYSHLPKYLWLARPANIRQMPFLKKIWLALQNLRELWVSLANLAQ